MKVKLLKKIRKRYDILPNGPKSWREVYVVSKRTGLVIDNFGYSPRYAVELMVRGIFGALVSSLIMEEHERVCVKRKSSTIKKVQKQKK